jgi:hypothetical protein
VVDDEETVGHATGTGAADDAYDDDGFEGDAGTEEIADEDGEPPATLFIEAGAAEEPLVVGKGTKPLQSHLSVSQVESPRPDTTSSTTVLADEELLAMKSLRIIGSPPADDCGDEEECGAASGAGGPDMVALLPSSKLEVAHEPEVETGHDNADTIMVSNSTRPCTPPALLGKTPGRRCSDDMQPNGH